MEPNKLVIIAGARRGIGKTFADYYRAQENTQNIGISRTPGKNLIECDLFDEKAAYQLVKNINLKGIDDIVYMHSIGIDKFEPKGRPHIDKNGDGIDDEVYDSNVTAFLNVAKPLIDRVKNTNTHMNIVNIGSLSDVFKVPYWQSFSKSKDKIRKFAKALHYDNIQNTILNVSSTLDEDNNKYARVHADTTYWQTSKELLDKSIGLIENMKNMNTPYLEADFFKPDPNFKADYFTNLPQLYKAWQRDLGCKGKDIPEGLRI